MKKDLKIECTNKLVEVLKDFPTNTEKVNSYMVRFHRLYLDGSYGDYEGTRDGGQKYITYMFQNYLRT